MDYYTFPNEIETIRKAISTNIEEGMENIECFHFGEFVKAPNQSGCFKRKNDWYLYDSDEKNFCTFCGPFSKEGIIYACAMKLHISKQMKGYRFTEEEFNIYLHNHFHSFIEIDAYNEQKCKINANL